jgi:nucleotide-binding universal stress UspA family protein
VVRIAEEIHADAIVVGSHGRTGLERLFLGSVSEHVVRHAHCPVLVVREPKED